MARQADLGVGRQHLVQWRVAPEERALISAVASELRRNRSDAMRYLVYEKAEELGLIPKPHAPRLALDQADAHAEHA